MQFDLFSTATRIATPAQPADQAAIDLVGDREIGDMGDVTDEFPAPAPIGSERSAEAPSLATVGSRTVVTEDGREACATGSATDDAGEVLLGSRKDRYRQALVLVDLEGLTGAQRVEQVVKDRVWPVPDYAALADAGRPPRVLALIKVVRDRLAVRPHVKKGEPFDPAAIHYITILSELQEGFARAETTDAVIAHARDIHNRYSQKGLLAICPARHSPLRLYGSDVAKADTLIAAGFPNPVETWKRGHSVRLWTGSPAQYALYRGRRWLGHVYPTEQAAWDALRSKIDAEKADRTTSGPRTPDYPHLTTLERVGPACRTGITAEDFITTFGFRGVQFGIWLVDRERQNVLDYAYAGLLDLAEVIGIPPALLALAGRREESGRRELGIAFGARGRGGRTAAHYEPGEVVINMTKFTGAGRVAHEFWHAIDHWLGLVGHPDEIEMGAARMASGGDIHDRNRKAALPDLDGDLVDALVHLIQACTRVTPTLENAMRATDRQHAHLLAGLRRTEALRDELPPRSRTPKRLADIASDLHSTQLALDMISERRAELAQGRMPAALIASESSRYIRQARILDPKTKAYWSTPCELTARAFEAWVLDRLASQGRMSQYLVHSAEEGFFSPPLFKADPFPSGEERVAINAAFDALMPLIARTIIARATR